MIGSTHHHHHHHHTQQTAQIYDDKLPTGGTLPGSPIGTSISGINGNTAAVLKV